MDLQTLQQECLACQRCGLCQTRTNVVFGQGVPNAEVLFVGEGPGASEDEQACPLWAAAASCWTTILRPLI